MCQLIKEERLKVVETERIIERDSRQTIKKGRLMDIKQSHQHPLEFSDVLQWNGERCNVCQLPILGASYSSTNCKCFVHELCIELPDEIEHLVHHLLPLLLALPPTPLYLNDVFICEICSIPGDGYSYHCP